jgi:ABC-2 type transport system ATP-binding protein
VTERRTDHFIDASPQPADSRGDAVLSVRGLGKRYGETIAVDDITFDVQRGEIVGLLGPNGAGKTTTISTILGVLQPSTGSVWIEGVPLATQRSRALSVTNFAAVYAPLPGNLTVLQNLRFFSMVYDVPKPKQRIAAVLDEFDLQRFANTRCGLLSSGEQTRVALAKAMLNAPRLLLLDEPTASLDPSAAKELREVIRNIASRDGAGILWTSHNMYEVEAVCDRVLFLSRGRILLEGDPRALPAQYGAATLEQLFIQLAREPIEAGA